MIRRSGLLQPITVVPAGEKWKEFQVVIGLRRYHACKELGLESISCCMDAHRERLASLALEENRHRKDLTNRELMEQINFLRSRGYTIEKLAEKAGTNKNTILTYLAMPKFPDAIQRAFLEGELSFGFLVEMRELEGDELVKMLKLIEKEGLSIESVRELVSLWKGKSDLPEFIKARALREYLGRNIVFTKGKKGVKLILMASDVEELWKILRRISG